MQSQEGNNIPVKRLVVILGLLATFGPFGTDMYLSAFPSMARDMGTDLPAVQITLSVYFIGLALGQMFYGPLVDRFGRRKPLLVGLTLFTLSSAMMIFVRDIDSFIAFRFLQAIGGCSGMIVGRAVVTDLFDLRGTANFMSMLAVVQGLGPILAPSIGSFMIVHTGWRFIFIFLTGFGILCLTLSGFGLRETLPVEKRQHVSFGEIIGDYLSLIVKRDFIITALASSIAGSCIFAYISASPAVFMHIFGLSAGKYGMLFAMMALSSIVASQVNRFMLRRISPQQMFSRTLVFGFIMLIVLFSVSNTKTLWVFVVPLWLSLVCVPLLLANGMAIAMDSSREKSGSASALLGLFQFGMASLASVLVSVLDDGTTHPMVEVMIACMVIGGILNLCRRRKPAKAAA